jgi:hypothetical protein
MIITGTGWGVAGVIRLAFFNDKSFFCQQILAATRIVIGAGETITCLNCLKKTWKRALIHGTTTSPAVLPIDLARPFQTRGERRIMYRFPLKFNPFQKVGPLAGGLCAGSAFLIWGLSPLYSADLLIGSNRSRRKTG